MNFLFHRHLAARDLGSPAAGVGAMLPDLWRMADRRVRAGTVPAEAASAERDVLLGVAHHLTLDRWFHGSLVFVEGERLAGERLRGAHITAPRTGLLAHVLWELCLDGALLNRAGLLPELAPLREGLLHARRGAAASAATLHHFGRVPRGDGARADFDRRLDRIFDELARGAWIEGYRSGEGIAARIQGVRAFVGLPPMDADDRLRLAGVAEVLLERAAGAAGEILAERAGVAA